MSKMKEFAIDVICAKTEIRCYEDNYPDNHESYLYDPFYDASSRPEWYHLSFEDHDVYLWR